MHSSSSSASSPMESIARTSGRYAAGPSKEDEEVEGRGRVRNEVPPRWIFIWLHLVPPSLSVYAYPAATVVRRAVRGSLSRYRACRSLRYHRTRRAPSTAAPAAPPEVIVILLHPPLGLSPRFVPFRNRNTWSIAVDQTFRNRRTRSNWICKCLVPYSELWRGWGTSQN